MDRPKSCKTTKERRPYTVLPNLADLLVVELVPAIKKEVSLGGNSIAKPAVTRDLTPSLAVTSSKPDPLVHVCVVDDESKSRRTFTVHEDVLLLEVPLFHKYTTEGSLCDMDITIHCSIHIFEWLMHYMLRNIKMDRPRLDARNVIAILVTADCLKMEGLVEECLNYCHNNLSTIVSTPVTFTAVNTSLLTRIAAKFQHSDLEDVTDKKDKIKSKLYCKLVESLFKKDCCPSHNYAGSASTLFRCQECSQYLTSSTQSQIFCNPNNQRVDKEGKVIYMHSRDPKFTVSDFLVSSYTELRSWRLVYWRTWGIVNALQCSVCSEWFLSCDINKCVFHPEEPRFPPERQKNFLLPIGVYNCCQKKVLRYDPFDAKTGCCSRDHSVMLSQLGPESASMYYDLLEYKELICLTPANKARLLLGIEKSSTSVEPTSTAATTITSSVSTSVVLPQVHKQSNRISQPIPSNLATSLPKKPGLASLLTSARPRPKMLPRQAMSFDMGYLRKEGKTSPERSGSESSSSSSSESEDSPGGESTTTTGTPRRMRKPWMVRHVTAAVSHMRNMSLKQTKNAPPVTVWNPALSLRQNQDCQREAEEIAMRELTNKLLQRSADTSNVKEKKFDGGLYSRIELSWKQTHALSVSSSVSSTSLTQPKTTRPMRGRLRRMKSVS